MIMKTLPRPGPRSTSVASPGFSLIEVTLAMGIFGGSILVLMGLTAITTEYAMTNREMTQATQLAARVYTDLSQPQAGAAQDDRNRALNPTTGTSTPYGNDIAPAKERYNSAPLTWVFSEGLSAITVPTADATSLYANGSNSNNARYVVGISFADEYRFQTPAVAPVAPPANTGVLKRVLVSVEAPAHLARELRRKYEFYRIMEFR